MLENFSFTAAWGHMIRDGHVAELVKDVVLAGNLFQTLDRIDHIARDFTWNQMGGGCGKGGQFHCPSPRARPTSVSKRHWSGRRVIDRLLDAAKYADALWRGRNAPR